MNTSGTTSNTSTASPLNLQALRYISELFPIPPKNEFVWRPDMAEKLAKDLRLEGENIFGFQVHIKTGQVMPGWMFTDADLAKKYLRDEITETELIKMLLDGFQTIARITES